MSILEFVLILQAIIIGLGIAELLTGTARVFRGELAGGRIHSLWIGTLFLLQAQFIWGAWDFYGDQTEWLFAAYLLDLTAPVALYLISVTLFPKADVSGGLDHHLIARRKPIFLLLGLVMLIYSLEDWLLLGTGITSQDLHRGAVLAVCLILAQTERPTVHWVLGVALLADVVIYALVFTGSIAVAGR